MFFHNLRGADSSRLHYWMPMFEATDPANYARRFAGDEGSPDWQAKAEGIETGRFLRSPQVWRDASRRPAILAWFTPIRRMLRMKEISSCHPKPRSDEIRGS